MVHPAAGGDRDRTMVALTPPPGICYSRIYSQQQGQVAIEILTFTPQINISFLTFIQSSGLGVIMTIAIKIIQPGIGSPSLLSAT